MEQVLVGSNRIRAKVAVKCTKVRGAQAQPHVLGRRVMPEEYIRTLQTELSEDGYYRGTVDGVVGSLTLEAVEEYLAENAS